MSDFIASNGLRIVLTNAGKTAYVADETEKGDSLAYLGFAEFLAFREFFQHERVLAEKPWHGAKAGDLWVLTCGGVEGVFRASVIDSEPIFHYVGVPSDEPHGPFTAGRRIWPEEAR